MSEENNTEPVQAYRLAFRAEGDFVNCYFADPATMDDALLLCSFRRTMLDKVPGLFEAWRMVVRDAMGEVNLQRFGVRGTFDETPAPEHEKSGRG